MKNAATETSIDANLEEAWTQAMEDGTQTVQSQKVKKVFVSNHRVQPISRTESKEVHGVYETRLDNGDEAILIDTGASINCVGSHFCERYDRLMETRGAPQSERVSFEQLPSTHYISGLGKGVEDTNVAACIPCHAHGLGNGLTYFKGAYLKGQASPAILGMCSLRSLNCIVDCRAGPVSYTHLTLPTSDLV